MIVFLVVGCTSLFLVLAYHYNLYRHNLKECQRIIEAYIKHNVRMSSLCEFYIVTTIAIAYSSEGQGFEKTP